MELAVESTSATDAARRLELPRQAVHYHVVALERAGFLRPDGEVRRRNMTERRLRASARSYIIAPDILGALSPGRRRATRPDSPQALLSLTARIQTDVSALPVSAPPVLSFASKLRFADGAARDAFARALGEAVTGLIREHGLVGVEPGRPSQESGFALALYPLPQSVPVPTYHREERRVIDADE